ncbi:MAG: mobile element protein [Acidimicrobiales bacterium]|nr:mobile element protein [Acidimicrobiales bacterium]
MTCPFAITRRRPGSKNWPDQELDHQLRLVCPITVLPISEPDRNHVPTGKEKRNEHVGRTVDFIIGVDTHKHTHSAAVVRAATGAEIEHDTQSADQAGYEALVEMADRHSRLRAWAIEGTGGYGAGLARHLIELGEVVIELDRPNRPARRHGAKSDPLDAVRAAREALARNYLAQPRSRGQRAALSVLLTVRAMAVQSAGDAQRQLQSLIVSAPEHLRQRFAGQTTHAIVTTASNLEIDPSWDRESRVIAGALRSLAQRSRHLENEAAEHERGILAIVRDWRPDLLEQLGIGPIVAATVLCAWSHPGRCRNEAAFASLSGTSPIPASSGLTNRHRLNRSGDRQLNRVLHVIVLTRLRTDPRTRAYAERRRSEGKSNREISRCLKRYVARQLFRQLESAT